MRFSSKWLLRRYRPRARWSLRSMLVTTGFVAMLCACCVLLRDRANLQDSVISDADNVVGQDVYLDLERSGPKWLDLVGADRFRRRVVGATVDYYSDDDDEIFLEPFARLPSLRHLNLILARPAPRMAPALGKMSQLQTLCVDGEVCHDGVVLSKECLAAVGKLTQLEHLHLAGEIGGSRLACLVRLTNLKSLSLQFNWNDNEQEADAPPRSDEASPLAHLPALPLLEAVDLRSIFGFVVGGHDVRHLAALPRLKSLNVSDVRITETAFAELASLESLEELAIGDDGATAGRLQSLRAIKRLKGLHILRYPRVTAETLAALASQETLDERYLAGAAMLAPELDVLYALKRLNGLGIDEPLTGSKLDRLTTLTLDRGDQIFALEGEVYGLQRALDDLRRSHPGIVIDSDPRWFDPNRERKWVPGL